MTTLNELKHGLEEAWESLAEGWHRLRERAAGALTRFKPGASVPAVPRRQEDFYLASPTWALLAGDVYEDDRKVVIRLEVPGMEKEDFNLELRGDLLIVQGEKRLERETSEGRYRVLQCAYGHFHRVIPLPAEVVADRVQASYRNGVLKIELPKAAARLHRSIEIPVR
ncbi:Hsp20/alpha crystallin family protein [Methylococcus capsulatus]|uniref:Hsp20/alpha crystallin family protein n=1 Tax=Methylococcus capsulatus TaxID=414 RepID=UPI001C527CC9|nr:Hsp20/alpha crystallin family protein [Methylococcus capsulatus]QXP87614.1 Hsp20/alpha crystallin family protein [Methylococcus capsulatus]QXP92646.1 Hsp20/alpha crystallin family protein [Methylococcus capsulatus]UQN12630.1 Hsp20/alpha crystallin family protein [Methylococcus capsulatus]